MKVLHLNSYDKRGGAETVFSITRKNVLTENFTACIKTDSTNEEYDVTFNNWENDNKFIGSINYIYSLYNKNTLYNFLQLHNIDIIHIHGFFAGLSPSILSAINEVKKHKKIKVVQTLHDFHLICPNASMYNYSNNKICELCVGKNLKTNIFFQNCDRRGYVHSFLKGIRSILSNNILSHKNSVDHFVSPSNFLRDKLIQDGFKAENISVIRNPVTIQMSGENHQKENRICYFGRFSKEKNIQFLISGFDEWKKRTGNNFKLIIIGNGEEENSIRAESENSISKNDIEIKRFMPHDQLVNEIKSSKYFVMSSTWYENSPMSILEAYALDIIPIVPDIGGMKESIEEIVKVGRIYISGDTESFIDSLSSIEINYENELKRVSLEKQNVLNELSINNYYKKLFSIYSALLRN